MKNKKKIILLAVVFLAITGLALWFVYNAKKDEQLTSMEKKEPEIVIGFLATYTEDYILYTSRNLMWICETESGEAVPLCDKAECRHEGYSTCNAAVEESYPEYPFIYQNKLYFFSTATKEYGVGTYVLYQADVNGANRKVLGVYDDIDFITALLVEDGYLYLACQTLYGPEDMNIVLEKQVCFVSRIDLANGDVLNLHKWEGYSTLISAIKCIEDKIYYDKCYSDIKIDYLNLDATDMDIYMYIKEHTYTDIYVYDIETKQETMIYSTNYSSGVSFGTKAAYVIVEEEMGKAISVPYDQPDTANELLSGNSVFIKEVGQQLLYLEFNIDHNYVYRTYNLNTGEADLLFHLNEDEGFTILAVTDSKIYLMGSKDNESWIGYMSSEDMFKGNYDKVHYIMSANME